MKLVGVQSGRWALLRVPTFVESDLAGLGRVTMKAWQPTAASRRTSARRSILFRLLRQGRKFELARVALQRQMWILGEDPSLEKLAGRSSLTLRMDVR